MRINCNGDFDIWQLGEVFDPMPHAEICADMWRYHNTTDSRHRVERSADVPNLKQAKRHIRQSFQVTCLNASQCGEAQNTALVYRGDGYEWTPAQGQPTVISFWVKSSQPGWYSGGLANGPENLSCPIQYRISKADVWEFKVLKLPRPPEEPWWFDWRVGYSLYFFLAVGAKFRGKTGSWSTGNTAADKRQANLNEKDGATFSLAGVQLETGTRAKAFDVWRYETEFAVCQRYIEMSAPFASPEDAASPAGGALMFSANPDTNGRIASASVRFSTPKRKVPAIKLRPPVPGEGTIYDLSAQAHAGLGRTVEVSQTGFALECQSADATLPGNLLAVHWIADASLPPAAGGQT